MNSKAYAHRCEHMPSGVWRLSYRVRRGAIVETVERFTADRGKAKAFCQVHSTVFYEPGVKAGVQ